MANQHRGTSAEQDRDGSTPVGGEPRDIAGGAVIVAAVVAFVAVVAAVARVLVP